MCYHKDEVISEFCHLMVIEINGVGFPGLQVLFLSVVRSKTYIIYTQCFQHNHKDV